MDAQKPSVAIGVDIGGTNMSAAVVDTQTGHILSRETIETLASQGPEDGMRRLCDLIRHVLSQARIEAKTIIGIGIGCTGPVDTERGLMQNPFTLPTWDDLPIVEVLAQAFQVPVLLLNDAHAAALAEHQKGAGRGTQSMVYITVSTGIGGGIIFNQRLYRGKALMAGEVGHQSIDYQGKLCYCGGHGCWEMYAAGPAIAIMAQERVSESSQIWTLAHGQPEKITAKLVGEAAQQADTLALGILREAGLYLGKGIANLINILAPEIVVMGGGVMQSQKFILPAVHVTLKQQSFMVAADDIKIVTAELGLNAGVVGAAVGITRFLANTL
ncbi:MAG: ROK family protein [Anaerolineae bacterium]|nr:ROK family protein [Anaerolineae bacterium]